MVDMGTKKPIIVHILCICLIGTALYSIITILWSEPADLLAKAIIFQSLKLAAGITLFTRVKAAPYLLASVLVWSLVITGLGYEAQPLTDQSTFTILYAGIGCSLLLSPALCSFYLKSKGRFVGNPNVKQVCQRAYFVLDC